MKYASNNIRNILIAGHAGSGKTTLTEALVYFSGAAERMGRVEDGTTISDFDPEEAKRKASLSASIIKGFTAILSPFSMPWKSYVTKFLQFFLSLPEVE